MKCRWVTDVRLATFGRGLVIASAVFGVTTVGSAGAALAASTIGTSPSAKVVSRAPMAVSVTFKEPLRGSGARIRVLSVDGDVGAGKVSTGQKTLRRDLRLGAPAGKYTVVWTAVSADGQKMSGQFSFQAARSNGEAELGRDPFASAEQVSPTPEPSGAPVPSGTPEWISGPGSIWTASPTTTHTPGALSAAGSGGSGADRSVSTGFTAIPLAVGGLLVLAAGMVSLINRPRLRG